MWVFTPEGFLSAVQDRDNPDLLRVRARDRASLRALVNYVRELPGRGRPEVVAGGGSDYPYRVTVNRADFAMFMFDTVDQCVDYENFKDAAKRVRGKKWAAVLGDIWSDGFGFTDREGRQHSIYYDYFMRVR
jgi:hypothetical protein